jgi:hypothetical protein
MPSFRHHEFATFWRALQSKTNGVTSRPVFSFLLKGVTMKTTFFARAALGCTLLAGSANAAVTVTFHNPEDYIGRFGYYGQYRDSHEYANDGRMRVMAYIGEYFERLGTKLPADQDLKIDVLNMNLLGGASPSGLRRVHWPAITLRYSLESQGRVLKSGEDYIKDMAPSCNRMPYGERLCAEKQMIRHWFTETLLTAKTGS